MAKTRRSYEFRMSRIERDRSSCAGLRRANPASITWKIKNLGVTDLELVHLINKGATVSDRIRYQHRLIFKLRSRISTARNDRHSCSGRRSDAFVSNLDLHGRARLPRGSRHYWQPPGYRGHAAGSFDESLLRHRTIPRDVALLLLERAARRPSLFTFSPVGTALRIGHLLSPSILSP